ncbi:MAG: TonB-dependent receptor, partial [Holophagales bacterium]|nr:TonB-dependent receptor [Holophagales bacterium]
MNFVRPSSRLQESRIQTQPRSREHIGRAPAPSWVTGSALVLGLAFVGLPGAVRGNGSTPEAEPASVQDGAAQDGASQDQDRENQADPEGPEGDGGEDFVRFVDEVVVTAGKRETFLLETPIAVTAPGQEQLDLLNIRDPKNLTQVVPSLNIVDSSLDGGGSVEINLRGISNSDFNETGDPNVSISIDGVYTARPQAALQLFYDVERVEVARGPQGTLAGRNASVGAINIIPRRPETLIFDASAEMEISDEGGRAFRGMVNYPILEGQLAVRFNVAAQERDSPYNLVRDDFNQVTGSPSKSVYEANFGSVTDLETGAGSRDDLAFRASLLYTPEAAPLKILFDYEDYDDRSPGNPGILDCDRIECGTTAGLEPFQIDALGRDAFTSIVSTPFRQDLDIENLRVTVQYDIEDKVSLKYKYGESTFHTHLIQDL